MTERIACPICGGGMPMEPHRPGTHWTKQEIWLIRRMKALGMSYAGIGRHLGVGKQAVAAAVERDATRPVP